jgi:hypothetical protein
LLLLDAALDDFAELLLDIAFELLETSQSSQTDEDETSSESVAELLSSPQATRTAATKPIVKNFFKVIKILQVSATNIDKQTLGTFPNSGNRRPS